ncbi:hypothetical protein MTO96_030058 [Rhipicephalus appendiculatus]
MARRLNAIRMPWTVHIASNYKIQRRYRQLACGGSILSRKFILTAAHCVNFGYRRPSSIDVRYNSTYLEEGPTASAKDVIRHPRFSMTTTANDIALVKLTEPLRFDKFVRPICLPMRRLQLVNKKAFASGWGKITEDQYPESHITGHLLEYKKTLKLPAGIYAMSKDMEYAETSNPSCFAS